MFPIRIHLAALIVAGVVSASVHAADPTPTAPGAETATQEQQRAHKSRSNIGNNREATSPDATPSAPAPGADAQGVVKTKTKSNQSND